MGAYAALEIGPDALNLQGVRIAASRIVTSLLKVIRSQEDKESNYVPIFTSNRFSALK